MRCGASFVSFNPRVCVCVLCLTCALMPLEQWMLQRKTNGNKVGAEGDEGQRFKCPKNSDNLSFFIETAGQSVCAKMIVIQQ